MSGSNKTQTTDILIVDDEADIRRLIQGILEDEGHATRQAGGAKECYEAIAEKKPDLIILDIWLQGSTHDGLEILEQVKSDHPFIPVIMISGHGTIETAVSSIQKGAYDFIEKPFKSDRLLLMIKRALETAELRRENEHLKKSKPKTAYDLIGSSSACDALKQELLRVSPTNSRVLITGAPGTGKEVAARFIHTQSQRNGKPFVVLNCATLHPDHLELELFGAAKTPEQEEKTGLLEQADGGTLFLDEVADMPPETQGKILRFLQDQKFQKLGSTTTKQVDVRILASSNRDLEGLISAGNFREDLYYRLNVVKIEIPLLKNRISDIPDLCKYFVDDISKNSGLNNRSFSTDTLGVFQGYDWPGNIRQLRNVVEWMLIMGKSKQGVFTIEDLPAEIVGTGSNASEKGQNFIGLNLLSLPLREAREKFEREYLRAQINRFQGNVSKTAEFIGMERSALHRKLKSLQVVDEKENSTSDDVQQKRA